MFFSRGLIPLALLGLGACNATSTPNRTTVQTSAEVQQVVASARPARANVTLCEQSVDVPTAAQNVERLRGEWVDNGRPEGSRGLCTGIVRYDADGKSFLTYVWGQGRSFPAGQETVRATANADGSFTAALQNGVSVTYQAPQDGVRRAEYSRNGQAVSRATMQPL